MGRIGAEPVSDYNERIESYIETLQYNEGAYDYGKGRERK